MKDKVDQICESATIIMIGGVVLIALSMHIIINNLPIKTAQLIITDDYLIEYNIEPLP
jgi:hypothetical protein